MEDKNKRAVIGDNQPSTEELIALEAKDELGELEALANDANLFKGDATTLVLETEEEVEKAGEIAKRAKAIIKSIDDKRKDVKEPYLRKGKDIDAGFKTHTTRADAIKTAFAKAVSDYANRKEAKEQEKQAKDNPTPANSDNEGQPPAQTANDAPPPEGFKRIWKAKSIDLAVVRQNLNQLSSVIDDKELIKFVEKIASKQCEHAKVNGVVFEPTLEAKI